MTRRRPSPPMGGLECAGMAAVTACCFPCLCLCGAGFIISRLFHCVTNYTTPGTRRRQAAEAARQTEEAMEEREARKLRVCAAKFLGPRLEGSLTIGRKEPQQTGGLQDHVIRPKRTDGQLQSPLFRLPLEVRRQIYEEVIGGYVIHIYLLQAYKRIGHIRCDQPDSERCMCRNMYKQKGIPDASGNIDLLAPLRSCRRVYSEAIEILYSCNTFEFDYLSNVLRLSLMILPERMRLIKNVQWQYCYENAVIQAIARSKNERRIPESDISFSRPWYDCKSPGYCPCLDCLPKSYSTDITNHVFIIYDWISGLR